MADANPGSAASLSDWLDWLLALHAQEIDLGLDRISLVADKMGVLSQTPLIISVAGTNGKGSSVAMLSSVYRTAGYQVGEYTSPHILSFNERIQINGTPVSDQQIVEAFLAIEAAREETKLTYFEFTTLAAWWIFQQAKLDVWVLEVGLGGRLDAVNTADADIALITSIAVDHTDWLGDTREEIALEKAGIMRAGKIAVCSDGNIPTPLVDYAAKQSVELWCLGEVFDFNLKPCQSISPDNDATPAWQFLVNSEYSGDNSLMSIDNLPFPGLKGAFQLQNAAGVVAVIQAASAVLPVGQAELCRGLHQASQPGRLQTLTTGNQAWLLDVAHNPQSTEMLARHLREQNFKGDAVFSVLADKDASEMIRTIRPFIRHWYIADLAVARSMPVDVLGRLLADVGVEENKISQFSSLAEATRKAYQDHLHDPSDIVCWGSFFTIAQCLTVLNEEVSHAG